MKYNFNYAKLNGNALAYAPNILVDGDVQIINASAEKYAEHGYMPFERTEKPEEEGFYFTPVYTEQDGKIVEAWEKHEMPETATETDYVNALEDLGVSFDE